MEIARQAGAADRQPRIVAPFRLREHAWHVVENVLDGVRNGRVAIGVGGNERDAAGRARREVATFALRAPAVVSGVPERLRSFAEVLYREFGITREQQDAYAAQSQERAAKAIAAGIYKDQIVPVEIKTRKGVVLFDTDEGVKADTTVDTLAKMKPAFKKEEGTVTAGNASTLNDGAGAVVMASAEKAKELGLKPLARLVSYAHAGVEPEYMGIGPVPASKLALEKAGLTVADLDLIEANEAFAAQACAVSKEMGFPNDKTNPNGSGISLGHPVGATGAILVTKAIYELQRTGGRYALITMCIGGGQGIAAIFERM